jgi:hypothetical protein
MADLNDQAQELAELLERVNYEMRRFGRISEETAEELAAGGTKRAKELKQAAASSVQALTSLAGAATASGRAMLEGQKGATAFNSALGELSTAATAAGVALTFLIPGGPAVKALIAAVTVATGSLLKYTQAANKLADDLYKGYSGLAKSGAAAADGMTGLFEDAKKLGLSMGELGDLVNIIGANSKDMALFGQGVFAARRRLADVGRELEFNRDQFIRMGLSMQDVTEATIGYMKQQRVAGNLNAQTAGQLADGARRYLIEQDALTKLTGMSVKEQEAAQEAIRSQERFAAKLEELRQQGRTKEARELEKTYLILQSQNKEAAQGFADISTNNVQTEAAQKSLMGTQGESMRVAQRISAGQMAAAEGAQRVARAHGETATRLGTTMGQIGTYNETFGDLAGDLRLRGLAEKDIAEVLAKIEEDRKRQAGDGAKVQDKILDKQGTLIATQIKANEALERFVFAGVGPAQAAMIKLAEATLGGANALNKLFGITPPSEAVAGTRGGERSRTRRRQQAEERAALEQAPVRSRGGAREQQARRQAAAADQALEQAPVRSRNARRPQPQVTVPAASQAPAAPAAAPLGPGPGAPAGADDYVIFGSNTGSREHFGKLLPSVQQAFLAMARDYNALNPGQKLRVNSAYRSPQEQAGVEATGGAPKAAPGRSLHQQGRAIDTQSEQASQLARSGLLAQYGFKWGQSFGDPQHIHMRDGGVIPATPGGVTVTAAEAGKNEAFVPLPDGKTIPVSLQGMDTERLISTIATLSAKLKMIQGDELIDIARNTSESAQREIDRMANTVAQATQEALSRGVDVVAATQIKPLEAMQDLARNMMAKGGITQGPSIAGEAGPEAVVPLPDGKTIPVRIDLNDPQQTGPTFAGMNEYKGYNMGAMTTDLAALKDIAGQLGAFDQATQTITNPETWKKILNSGMLTNYDMGTMTVGSKMGGPEIGIEIGERIKEVMVTEKTDVDSALKQVTQEFRDSMTKVIESVRASSPEQQGEMIELLRRIASGTNRTADANQRLAAVATN